MERGRPPVWRLVLFFAVLAVAAAAFGAVGLPRLAVVAPPEQWRLAAEEPAPPVVERERCRHDERPFPRAFDDAR